MVKDSLCPDAMATTDYIADVSARPENKQSKGNLKAAATTFEFFWTSARPEVWPALPEKDALYQFRAGLPTVGDAAEPEAKRARTENRTVFTEPDCSTDVEIERMSAQCASAEEKEYVLQSCRGGRAWAVIPEYLHSVVLDPFSSRIIASGWTCNEKKDHRWSFQAGKDQVANLVLFAAGGRLLVRTADRKVAEKVGDLYAQAWLSEYSDIQ